MSRARLLQSVALMMAATLVGKALLLAREMLIAHFFGASGLTDGYNVAMTVVTSLLAVTVAPVAAVLVPVYVEWLAQDRSEAQALLNTVFTLYLTILSFCLAVVTLGAPLWVQIYAPGFIAETQALTVGLLRVLALFMVLNGFAGYLQQVLTAHHEFRLISLASVAANLLAVVLLLALASHLGIAILAWGAVAGAALQLVIYLWGLRRYGIQQRLSLGQLDRLRKLGRLSLWMLGGHLAGQLSVMVDRNLLSRLPAGAIATLGFARNIYLLPFEVFTTGLTRVIITYFSWDAAHGDVTGLKRNFSLSIRLAAFFMIPATAGLIVLRFPIVRLLYERGEFTAADTAATAPVVVCYAAGLFFEATKFIAGRVYLSRQDTAFPVLMSLPSLAFSVGFDLLFIPWLGAAGVALAYTLSNLLISLIFVVRLRWQLGPMDGRRITRATVKIVVAATVMGLAISGSTRLIRGLPDGLIHQIAVLALGMTVGSGVYLGMLTLLRLEELGIVRDIISNVVRRLPEGLMP